MLSRCLLMFGDLRLRRVEIRWVDGDDVCDLLGILPVVPLYERSAHRVADEDERRALAVGSQKAFMDVRVSSPTKQALVAQGAQV